MKIMGGLLGLLILSALAFVLLFDINDWKGWIEQQATAALGRDVTIDGPIDIAWGWTPTGTIQNLRIANADWAEAEHFAEVEKLEASIKLWEQLKGRTVLTEIIVERPALFLEQQEDGTANWSFGEAGAEDTVVEAGAEEATVPDDRTEFPVIEKLVIDRGIYGFLDRSRDIDLDGSIQTVAGEGGGGEGVEVDGKGRLEGEDFSIDLSAGALTTLRDPDIPYPVDLELTLGETALTVNGTLTRPLDLAGIDLSLSIEGESMANAFPITGLPLPPTPPYRLKGDLTRDGERWRFSGFDGRLGDSDLRGTIGIDLGEDPLRFDIDLESDRFDIDDLAGVIGAPTEDQPDEADDGRVIPDQPINLDRLRAANGEATLRAGRIVASGLPIDDLTAALTLEDGVLRLEPADFGVAGGNVNLWLSLYGNENPVQIDMLSQVRDLRLKDMFRGSDYVQETGGKIDGRIELSGRGNALRDMLATADGRSNLVVSEGHVSALLLELAGLDAMEALGLYFDEADSDVKVPIRCLATEFAVEDGIATSELAVLDTEDTRIEAQGSADLGAETLDFVVTPHPKDITFLTLRSNVHVEGRFADPSIALDAGSILKFIPLVDLGLAEDAPCKELIARAKNSNT